MPRQNRALSEALTRNAANFLRDMADLIENNDVYTLDFHRDTAYHYLLSGRRLDDEPPVREKWVIAIDMERDLTRER